MHTVDRGADVPDVWQQAMEEARGRPQPRFQHPSRKVLTAGLFGGVPESLAEPLIREVRLQAWRDRRKPLRISEEEIALLDPFA